MDTMPIVTPRQAGIYVRRSRESQGLTRAQLAAAAGVSERLLASLELGDATGIRLDKLLAVFGALGIGLAAQGDDIGRNVIATDESKIIQSIPALAAPQSFKPEIEPGPHNAVHVPIRRNHQPTTIPSLTIF